MHFLQIDVEGHEGHVLAGGDRLFQQLYVPYVWLEWEDVHHVTSKYGSDYIITFMRTRSYAPHDVISGERLAQGGGDWPSTVLWVHAHVSF
jgi:hypothetical protein